MTESSSVNKKRQRDPKTMFSVYVPSNVCDDIEFIQEQTHKNRNQIINEALSLYIEKFKNSDIDYAYAENNLYYDGFYT